MTVADNTSRNQYTATNLQVSFAYTFEIVDKGDIVVLKNGTTLSEGADYTVFNVGNDNGGTIELTAGATAGDILTLYRDMPYSRTQNYTNSGDFLASEVNSDFDNLWLAGEQTNRSFSQSIRKPITDSDSISMELPEAASRADRFLTFDSTGAVTTTAVSSATAPQNIYRQQMTGDGTTTAFTLNFDSGSVGGAIVIYIDGVYQEGDTYNASGTSLVFTEAPPVNASIEVMYFKVAVAADVDTTGTIYSQQFTGNGSTTAYTLGIPPGSTGKALQIFINGIYQDQGSYTVSGATLTFSEAPPNTSQIDVIAFRIKEIGATDANLVTYTPAGTGAVPTTVQTKLRESVSVKDFGAVGDGTTDDTAAIQAAIDYAAIAGKIVFFPAAEYKISSLTLPAQDGGILLKGEARVGANALNLENFKGAVLKSDSTTGDIISANGGVTYANRCLIVEDISLKVATSGYAISLIGAPEPTQLNRISIRNTNASGGGVNIENCYSGLELNGLLIHTAQGNTGTGLRLTSNIIAGGITANTCQITGFGKNLHAVTNLYQISLNQCAFEQGGYGAYIDGECSVLFERCHFEFNNENAVFLNSSTSTVITKCSFYSNAQSVSAGQAAEIDVDGNPAYNLNVIIDGSYCFGLASNNTFVRLSNPAFGSGYIGNNFVESISGATNTKGIDAIGGGAIDTWALENNYFINITTEVAPTTGWRKFITSDDATLYFKGGPRFDGSINVKGVEALDSDATSVYLKSNSNIYFQSGGVTKATLTSTGNLSANGSLSLNGLEVLASDGTSTYAKANGTYYFQFGGTTKAQIDSSGNLNINGAITAGASNVIWSSGTGTPEGAVTAPVGSIFSRTDGGAGTSFYVKESGTGNTGWVAK